MAQTTAQRDIIVQLKTLFDGTGFRSFSVGLKNLTAQAHRMNQIVRQDLTQAFGQLGKSVLFNQKSQQSYWDSYFANSKKAKKLTGEVTKSTGNLRGAMLGMSLSFLFFGMALKRAASSVWKFGTNAFQEIMHSVEGTITQFDLLEGSMKYLGFSIGQALEPLLPILIQFIDWVTNFVQNHPGLVRVGVAFAAIAGSILMIGGQIGSFVVGIAAMKFLLNGSWATKAPGAIASVGDAAVVAHPKVINLKNALYGIKTLVGAGLLLYVGYQLFNKPKDTAWTTSDFLKNLGLATVGGYMFGGPWGALAAFALTLVVMVAQDSVKNALKQVKGFVDAKNKLLSGEALTVSEAYKIAFEGTALPDEIAAQSKRDLEKWVSEFTNFDQVVAEAEEAQRIADEESTREAFARTGLGVQKVEFSMDPNTTIDWLSGKTVDVALNNTNTTI